jgi:hypothetical protein
MSNSHVVLNPRGSLPVTSPVASRSCLLGFAQKPHHQNLSGHPLLHSRRLSIVKYYSRKHYRQYQCGKRTMTPALGGGLRHSRHLRMWWKVRNAWRRRVIRHWWCRSVRVIGYGHRNCTLHHGRQRARGVGRCISRSSRVRWVVGDGS